MSSDVNLPLESSSPLPDSVFELFKLLGVSREDFDSKRPGNLPIDLLICAARTALVRATVAIVQVEGLVFWGSPLLTHQEHADCRNRLTGHRSFLESILLCYTAERLASFRWDNDAVRAQIAALELIAKIERLHLVLPRVTRLTQYLSRAELVLPADHTWRREFDRICGELVRDFASPDFRDSPEFHRRVVQTLEKLKSQYQDIYLELHSQMMTGNKLVDGSLGCLQSCRGDLLSVPFCKSCKLIPVHSHTKKIF